MLFRSCREFAVPKWRNGRRRGFKIPRLNGLVGSSPTLGTTFRKNQNFIDRGLAYGRRSNTFIFHEFSTIAHLSLKLALILQGIASVGAGHFGPAAAQIGLGRSLVIGGFLGLSQCAPLGRRRGCIASN